MWYQTGIVTTVNGSSSVTGVGTTWLGQVNIGDLFTVDRLTFYEVAAVASDTSLSLTSPYGGASAEGQFYAVILNTNAAATNFISAAVALLTPQDRVLTVFGRAGVVTAQAGDYAASQVTVTPVGGIGSFDVQGSLAELDAKKASLAGANFAGTVRLAAGTGSASPLVLQAGSSLSVPVLGATDFDGNHVFVTVDSMAPTRKIVAFTDSDITGTASNVTGVVAIDHGGTGATTAAGALVNLGAAPLASPNFSGAPTAPTPITSDSSTQIATTAFVKAQGYITPGGAPVQSVAGKTGVVTLVVGDVSGAAPLTSPGFNGTPTAPTVVATDNSTQLATTAFVKNQNYITATQSPVQSVAGKTGSITLVVGDVSGAAPIVSPSFSGTPTAPTATASDNSTQLATTAFVKNQNYITAALAPVLSVAGKTGNVTLTVSDISGAAPLMSPALGGVPTAPTASIGTSSTQLATTAFVAASVAAPNGSALLWSQIFS